MPDKCLQATHGSPDRPLKIGNIEIPCYVLEDGRRVISQRGLKLGLGMNATGGARRMTAFIESVTDNPRTTKSLTVRINAPIKFMPPGGGAIAHGYEATVLADLCDAVVRAQKSGQLHSRQTHIAKRCEILNRGFAKVGIIALVDEATGYQNIRARSALEAILDKFIRKEFSRWAKRFPDEFYEQMFRLRGWKFSEINSVNRPGVVGKWTNEIVYRRLAPGVLDDLRRRNPTDPSGHRKRKHHQWLTEDIGHPKLREHIASVIALMRASGTWTTFYRLLQRAMPKYMETGYLFPEADDPNA